MTGANKGIGYSIAQTLLERGCNVLLGSRDTGRGEAAVVQLTAADPSFAGRVQMVQLDVVDAASIAACVETVTAKLGEGKLAGIVNNAGGADGMG